MVGRAFLGSEGWGSLGQCPPRPQRPAAPLGYAFAGGRGGSMNRARACEGDTWGTAVSRWGKRLRVPREFPAVGHTTRDHQCSTPHWEDREANPKADRCRAMKGADKTSGNREAAWLPPTHRGGAGVCMHGAQAAHGHPAGRPAGAPAGFVHRRGAHIVDVVGPLNLA